MNVAMQSLDNEKPSPRQRLALLQAEVDRRQARARLQDPERLSTGVAAWDRLLGGGLERGGVVSLEGLAGAGGSSLAALAVARATQAGQLCAWVMGAAGSGGLVPAALQQLGVVLSHLLVVRSEAADAAWAAQLLLRSGLLSLVVADLPAQGWPVSTGVRLGDAARAGRSALLLLCEGPAPAPVRLQLSCRMDAVRLAGRSSGGAEATGWERSLMLQAARGARGPQQASVRWHAPPRLPAGLWQPDRQRLEWLRSRSPPPATAGDLPLFALSRPGPRRRGRWRALEG